MEAFSDGVFSIAATLLVLDIAIHPPGTALEQVLHAWPFYLAYLVSFLTIGAGWLAHTQLTDGLTRADPLLLRINLLVLLVVAFLPFPTKLVADALHSDSRERVFVTLYGLTLLVIRSLSFALDAYARREHLYTPPEAGEEQQDAPLELLPVLGGYVAAILLGLVGTPSGRRTLLCHSALHDPFPGASTTPASCPSSERERSYRLPAG